MKKFVYLVLAALAIVSVSCSHNNGAASAADAPKQGDPTATNIRYVWGDSITANYVFSQTIEQENQRLQTELIAYANQLQNQLQNMQQQFQQKLQNNGYLTEAAAQTDAKKIQSTAANYDNLYAKREAEVREKLDANNKALHDSIQNFIKIYNEEKQFDAILYREFNLYINPALDITNEIVEGLNARYKVPVETAEKK